MAHRQHDADQLVRPLLVCLPETVCLLMFCRYPFLHNGTYTSTGLKDVGDTTGQDTIDHVMFVGDHYALVFVAETLL
jgi:hypothetical protein